MDSRNIKIRPSTQPSKRDGNNKAVNMLVDLYVALIYVGYTLERRSFRKSHTVRAPKNHKFHALYQIEKQINVLVNFLQRERASRVYEAQTSAVSIICSSIFLISI